jgi:diacylglycerol kinase family enzyme
VSSTPDARFAHASDGCLDLIVAQRSLNPIESVAVMLRHVGRMMGLTDERYSRLYTYAKVSTAVLTPAPGQEDYPANIDGETWRPGPFTLTVLPSLLTAYGRL